MILDKPESMVEADLKVVRQQAEKDYTESIRKHNEAIDRAEKDKAAYEAAKAAWLAEEATRRAQEEDKAFQAAMAQRGVRLPDGSHLTNQWT